MTANSQRQRVVHTGLYGKEAEALCRLARLVASRGGLWQQEKTRRDSVRSSEGLADLYTSYVLSLYAAKKFLSTHTARKEEDILPNKPTGIAGTIMDMCDEQLPGLNRIFLDERSEVCFSVDDMWNESGGGSMKRLLSVFKYILYRLTCVDSPGCREWTIAVSWRMTANILPTSGFDNYYTYHVDSVLAEERITVTQEDFYSLIGGLEQMIAGAEPDRRSKLFKPETNPIAIEASRVLKLETDKAISELSKRCLERTAIVEKVITEQLTEVERDMHQFAESQQRRFD